MNGLNDDITAEGWLALCICILKGVTQQEAFTILEEPMRYKRLTDKDMQQVEAMRNQGERWIDIAAVYGLERTAMQHRYHNWKSRNKRKQNSEAVKKNQ